MKRTSFFLAIYLFFICISGCTGPTPQTDYSLSENWAYCEMEENTYADVFFLCPTIYTGDDNSYNMPLTDKKAKASFLGAIHMEKGIYDGNTRFFAPYYQQAGLHVYTLSEEKQEIYLQRAYEDVKASFSYYLEHWNQGRPLILAGFSQGADMCIRLLKDFAADQEIAKRLIACYAIGWRITQDELDTYPFLAVASGENDTGVIISFNSEAEWITDSLIVPQDVKTLSINPLNWKTDSTPADSSLNIGACFTDYEGNIVTEIPNLTGAYIDPERGTLKVPDINSKTYPAALDIFQNGVYHIYDYQFFYRNLQKNVQTRLQAYQNQCER